MKNYFFMLGCDEYQRLLSRLLPWKPDDLKFRDLILHLKKQFHDNKTFVQRFEALNFRTSLLTTAVEILHKVNVLGDTFELNSFIIDQLKILHVALALNDHAYHTERIILFKVAAEEENVRGRYRNLHIQIAQRM